jgi:hypothetical protein
MEQSLAESRSIRLSFQAIRISFNVGTNRFVYGLYGNRFAPLHR